MKIGLISDIHGNLPALEAVIEDMPKVDEIVCAGDIVGYNPWPATCLERVRDVASTVVQGNHDRAVGNPEAYATHEQARAGLELAARRLDEEQREWLAARPQRTTFADSRYRLVHSHPDPERLGAYVWPHQAERLRAHLDDHDGIVFGHTHVQCEAVVDGRVIVNPGSVGQPRDGDPDAAYAILETDTDAVELRRVSYDIDRVLARVEASPLPVETGTRLLDGS